LKDSVVDSFFDVAWLLLRSRSENQEAAISSNVSEGGSAVLDCAGCQEGCQCNLVRQVGARDTIPDNGKNVLHSWCWWCGTWARLTPLNMGQGFGFAHTHTVLSPPFPPKFWHYLLTQTIFTVLPYRPGDKKHQLMFWDTTATSFVC
jgi:hypothetical protein